MSNHPLRPYPAWSRLGTIVLTVLALVSSGPAACETIASDELEKAGDLQAVSQAAASRNLVILLAATREGCSYCALLKREILVPMIRSGSYDDKVLIRELVFEPETRLLDFDGSAVSSDVLVRRYSVDIAPTVLLLDNKGSELHAPLVGINTSEMYGYYLDEAIDEALSRLKSGRAASEEQE